MLKEKNKLIRRFQQATDYSIIAASFFIAYIIRCDSSVLPPLRPISDYLFLLYIAVPLWAILLNYNNAYRSLRTKALRETIFPMIKTALIGGFVLITVLYVFKLDYISRALVLLFISINAFFLTSSRMLIYYLSHYIRRRGYNFRTVLIVGADKKALAFADIMEQHKEWGVNVTGFIDLDGSSSKKAWRNRIKIIGNFTDFKEILTSNPVDEVIFVIPKEWLGYIEEAIMICETIGIKASITADFYPHTIAKATIEEELKGWPLLTFNPTQRTYEVMFYKRVIDVSLSLIILFFVLPILLVSAIAIKLSSKGPVFFRQVRCGMNGRKFNLLKFRTMVADAEKLKEKLMDKNEMYGPVFKIKKDPRVTSVGRILRKYSFDELPQFINVLRGEMSIVGPRPSMPSEVEQYDMWQRRRLSVKPGITCLWQVCGRNEIGFEEWMKLDLEYIDNWSWKLDMRIFLKTIPAVLKGTGM